MTGMEKYCGRRARARFSHRRFILQLTYTRWRERALPALITTQSRPLFIIRIDDKTWTRFRTSRRCERNAHGRYTRSEINDRVKRFNFHRTPLCRCFWSGVLSQVTLILSRTSRYLYIYTVWVCVIRVNAEWFTIPPKRFIGLDYFSFFSLESINRCIAIKVIDSRESNCIILTYDFGAVSHLLSLHSSKFTRAKILRTRIGPADFQLKDSRSFCKKKYNRFSRRIEWKSRITGK